MSDYFFLLTFRLTFFSSDYNPHTDRSTFLTILTILKSYSSYLANLKYFKSLRSSIFTSSKKLKGTKGYSLRVFSALWDFFSKKVFPQRIPPSIFLQFSDRTDVEKSQRIPPFSFFGLETFFQKNFSPKVPLQFFLMICDRMDEKFQSVPSGAPIRFNFWVFPVP